MPIRSYRDLDVWQQAMTLVEQVYRVSAVLPASERYGLTSHVQRAAVSVPANIAEGHARRHRGDYVHHLSIARGSLAEVETHLILAVRLEMLAKPAVTPIWRQAQRVGQLLNKLIVALRRKPPTDNPGPRSRTPDPD
jgi:four helix bundle protein